MNTRCREWLCIGLALVLAAGIYAFSHRHLSQQVALDREAMLVLYNEIIDLHWQQLTETERVANGVTWDSLKWQVSFRNIRAKQTGVLLDTTQAFGPIAKRQTRRNLPGQITYSKFQ